MSVILLGRSKLLKVTFDAAIEVVVVDLAGNSLPHATATVRTLPNNSSGRSRGNGADKGQMYALGAAPRRCSLTVPCEIEVVAHCFGHTQVTHLLAMDGPLALNHSSWPLSRHSSSLSFDAITAAANSMNQPGGQGGEGQAGDDEASALAAALTAAVSVGGGSGARLARAQQVLNRAATAAAGSDASSGGVASSSFTSRHPSSFTGGPPPLTIVVRMRRFDVLFECVDIMGRPLSAQCDDVIGSGPAWRLLFSEHTADSTSKPSVYEVRTDKRVRNMYVLHFFSILDRIHLLYTYGSLLRCTVLVIFFTHIRSRTCLILDPSNAQSPSVAHDAAAVNQGEEVLHLLQGNSRGAWN